MQKIIDRFDEYMRFRHLNDNQVTVALGLTNGVIGKSRKEGRDLSKRVIEQIENYYTDLNIDWLLTGEGEMLLMHHSEFELVKSLADRLSEIINDIHDDLSDIASDLGVTYEELMNFTDNLVWPSNPIDFARFIRKYPEYNYRWLLVGYDPKFNGDERNCLEAIKQRVYQKNHPEYFPDSPYRQVDEHNNDQQLWQQIAFLNGQLKEKDEQIRQLMILLQKK